MIRIRKSDERGRGSHGWLESRFTFSFADYHDPEHMGFRELRVINEDWVQPGTGFGTHPHRNMEIITFIMEGEVEHKDDTGSSSVLRAGEVQRMTAGSGIAHSEMNPSPDQNLHLYQIWVLPEVRELQPGYEQKAFSRDERRDRWQLLASRTGREGSLHIHSGVELWASVLSEGTELQKDLAEGHGAWIQVASGSVSVLGQRLDTGDAAAIEGEPRIVVRGEQPAEVLLFDLP